MISGLLVRNVGEAHKAQRSLDPELLLWVRAVEQEGRRWATRVDVSDGNAPDEESSQSNHHAQLTAADVANELGCKPANVHFHVREGHLWPARTNPYLFDRAEVDRFIDQRRSA